MIILGDDRIPEIAKENLARLGTFVPFLTTGITYEAISGHPDLFFCQGGDRLVVAPNTPEKQLQILKQYKISFETGKLPVGKSYPETARYNAVVSDDFLIHNTHITDESLKNVFSSKRSIHVNQAYTRCSLVPLKNGRFLTSDGGIFKTLQSKNIELDYFSPQGILLPGFDHGFLGGALGLFEDKAYLLGQLKSYPDGSGLGEALDKAGYEVIELYPGPFFDGGSLLLFP